MPEQVPDGSIVISPREFYDGVRADIEEIKRNVTGLPRRVEKLEAQLETLKAKVWFMAGAAAVAGSLATALVMFGLHVLTGG